ncbi:hypothetical protein HOLleu_20671 [Holothuria leucospilota]|uniref:Integrase catalytic domain-containing protein n=1 Tax=Holothuria leucospilota TaxID=206669 RepID=A0A9Q1C261_HOLLE|nr:hypothetical protein HOLleu_20671 [Holothuria leucospilota]
MQTVFKKMLYELSMSLVEQIKSSAYHPESQEALERFHQTLKNMIKTYCHDNERDWDEGIPFLMFAAREFKSGDRALVFVSVFGQPFQSRFHYPYPIERKVSDTDYVILTSGKGKSERVCHIDIIKKYYERREDDTPKKEIVDLHGVNINAYVIASDPMCVVYADNELSNDEVKANHIPDMCIKLKN